eukprot:2206321-Pleurochrysis_carterae.AAC.4
MARSLPQRVQEQNGKLHLWPRQASTSTALSNAARRAGSSAATANNQELILTRPSQATLSDADVYCEQMEGSEEYDKTTREKFMCKLKMALNSNVDAKADILGNRLSLRASKAMASRNSGSNCFKSEFSDEVDKFIGLKVTRDRNARTVTLSQGLYIKKMADRFLPNKSGRCAIPLLCLYASPTGSAHKHVYAKLGLTANESAAR